MSDEKENAPLDVGQEAPNGRHEFVRRAWAIVLILASVAGTVLLLWVASQVLLLLFAGVLLAIFLRTVSGRISHWTKMPEGVALAVTILGGLGILVAAGWILAAPASEQFQQLSDEIPKAVNQLELQLEKYQWGKMFVARIQNFAAELGPIFEKATSFFSVTIESFFGIFLIVFFGIYFAADPDLYIDGFLQLLPNRRRARAYSILMRLGVQLRHWLEGQLITMTIIGVLTWVGLLLMGVPLPGMLGMIAGLLDFVPVVGPWVAGILSALLGLVKEPILPVYVAILFVGLHLLESHLLIPWVQKFSTRLPPVLTILALALFTKWFGFLGLLLATPLLVLVLVLVRSLYQEDVLHEKTKERK